MDVDSESLELFHYGVKGMRWGVTRRDIDGDGRVDQGSLPKGLAGVPAKTSREAKRDSNEHAKAKMFYGEGAGNRRKLINAKVTAKSKDPAYKKAFDYHSEHQDMAKRASQARGMRRRKDVKNTTAKTARGIKNLALKTGAPVTLTAIALYGAYQNPAVRRTVNNYARTAYTTARDSPVTDYVRNRFGG